MAKRRFPFLPISLIVIVAIALVGVYLASKAPHIVAAVVIVSAIIVGALSFVARFP